jgi:tetratricopeptide (TPR) repeat protein
MKKTPLPLRIAFGSLALLVALPGLVWTFQALRAEYGFHVVYDAIIHTSRTERPTLQTLTTYTERLGELCRIDPTNGEIRNLYATMLGNLGRLKNDETCFRQAMAEINTARRTLNNRTSLFFLADMYERLHDIPSAEATMADCLLINPTDTEFNPGWLHLLLARLAPMNLQKVRGQLKDTATYDRYCRIYAQAANNWAIRASNDKNSYHFLANFYIDPPCYTQAYKLFLVGLSGASWINLNPRAMIDERRIVNDTIRKIINGRYAKPYLNLP